MSHKYIKPDKVIQEIPPNAFKIAFPIPQAPSIIIYGEDLAPDIDEEDELFKNVLEEKFSNNRAAQAQIASNNFNLEDSS